MKDRAHNGAIGELSRVEEEARCYGICACTHVLLPLPTMFTQKSCFSSLRLTPDIDKICLNVIFLLDYPDVSYEQLLQ